MRSQPTIFILVSIFVPIITTVLLPKISTLVSGKQPVTRWPLIVGGLLFCISWYLPSPDIQGRDTAFVTHFIGGGVFTGFVWLYLKRQFQWNHHPLLELLALYFLVSGLGVANELFEFAVDQAGVVRINPWDTWWDFVANTAGAALFFCFYSLFSHIKKHD